MLGQPSRDSLQDSSDVESSVESKVEGMVARARSAQRLYEFAGNQALFDRMSEAVAWGLMEPSRNRELSVLAVADTGLGNVEDKFAKNYRKTLGLMSDLRGICSYGLFYENEREGIAKYFRPKGVVAALVPSTNPLATPINNIVNAVKTGNSIIVAPSPKGASVLQKLLSYVQEELSAVLRSREFESNLELQGLVVSDLVQMLPLPPSKEQTSHLMQQADFVVATGSQNNVRAACTSGTPAIGVGVGNVVVIVDESADLASATSKIASSKCFDNATSCSSENALVVLAEIYDDFVAALGKQGGFLLNDEQTRRLESMHWRDGKLQAVMLGKDIEEVLAQLDLRELAPADTRFLVIPMADVARDARDAREVSDRSIASVLAGEKMARFLSLYRVQDFSEARILASKILNYQGAGHSLGLHTTKYERASELAMLVPTSRIILNQGHCFATGGSFTNSLPFSLSMGCGSWGGNLIDENLHWRHFVNCVRVVRPLASREPSLDSIFGDYWREVGQS